MFLQPFGNSISTWQAHVFGSSIVVAALFLPFLSQIVALRIGLWSGDKKLAGHGLKAVIVSVTLGFISGSIVALIEDGPVAFHGFRGPLSSFASSAVIGGTAGLSNADDTGRRYLVGVEHLFSLVVNFGTIAGTSVFAYALCHNRDGTAEPG